MKTANGKRTSNNKKKRKERKKIYLIFNFIRDAKLFVIIRYNYTKSTEKVKKKKKRERKIGGPFFFLPKCNNIVVAVKWCKDVRVGKVIK